MNLYGLIGYPLQHSFSEKYFTEKFHQEKINARYELYALSTIDHIYELLDKNPSLRGLNVTIPYKQSVLAKLDDTSNIPAGIAACNCIKINKGKLSGYNTDIIGFEKSILTGLKSYHSRALILGNGGAAAAVKYVFKKIGIDFTVVSRNMHDDTSMTYAELTEDIISWHTLIINTTPLGMYPSIENFPAIPYNALEKKHHLFDMIYNPEKTLFLKKGTERGASIQNGYEMFLLQADESWRLWKENDA